MYLTTLMISSKNSDSLRISHLEGHQKLVIPINQHVMYKDVKLHKKINRMF